jgi:hypothetical protein
MPGLTAYDALGQSGRLLEHLSFCVTIAMLINVIGGFYPPIQQSVFRNMQIQFQAK